MLGVFSDGTETIVCELDGDGQPITNGYFTRDNEDGDGNKGDQRDREDYDFALVEAPVRIERGSLKVEPERIMSGAV